MALKKFYSHENTQMLLASLIVLLISNNFVLASGYGAYGNGGGYGSGVGHTGGGYVGGGFGSSSASASSQANAQASSFGTAATGGGTGNDPGGWTSDNTINAGGGEQTAGVTGGNPFLTGTKPQNGHGVSLSVRKEINLNGLKDGITGIVGGLVEGIGKLHSGATSSIGSTLGHGTPNVGGSHSHGIGFGAGVGGGHGHGIGVNPGAGCQYGNCGPRGNGGIGIGLPSFGIGLGGYDKVGGPTGNVGVGTGSGTVGGNIGGGINDDTPSRPVYNAPTHGGKPAIGGTIGANTAATASASATASANAGVNTDTGINIGTGKPNNNNNVQYVPPVAPSKPRDDTWQPGNVELPAKGPCVNGICGGLEGPTGNYIPPKGPTGSGRLPHFPGAISHGPPKGNPGIHFPLLIPGIKIEKHITFGSNGGREPGNIGGSIGGPNIYGGKPNVGYGGPERKPGTDSIVFPGHAVGVNVGAQSSAEIGAGYGNPTGNKNDKSEQSGHSDNVGGCAEGKCSPHGGKNIHRGGGGFGHGSGFGAGYGGHHLGGGGGGGGSYSSSHAAASASASASAYSNSAYYRSY